MVRTLKNIFRQDKDKFVVPKSVQQAIPVQEVWENGIFKVGKNKFARTYKFEDINYAVASRQDFEKAILLPMKEDGLDLYCKEYNGIIEEAKAYFTRVGTELTGHFKRFSSKCVELNAAEKLRILHDFYRIGEETGFHFDLSETMKKGHDFKDFICPDSFEFEKNHFCMGDRYGRALFLQEYASYIKDKMLADLTDLNPAVIPYDMEQQRKESWEFLDDLTTRDLRICGFDRGDGR